MTFIRKALQERLIMLVCLFFHPLNPINHFLTKKKTDDDYAAYILALHLGKPQTIIDFLYERAMRTPFSIYNNATGFMEARNANGTWAGPDNGWTEGMYHGTLRVIFINNPWFINKGINGPIHSMWCMIYPS